MIGDEPRPLARFSYSLDGITFAPIGEAFQLHLANYRGSRLALCCYNPDGEAGRLDVDWLHYDYPNPLRPTWKPSAKPRARDCALRIVGEATSTFRDGPEGRASRGSRRFKRGRPPSL